MSTRARAAAIEALHLADVSLPTGHPAAGLGGYPVFGFLIRHADGLFVVDTGVGTGNDRLDELYRPVVANLEEVLARRGVHLRDVSAVINTHLHFDHCGQNSRFDELEIPIFVQAAEALMVDTPGYTVREFARIPEEQARLVDGDAEIVPGIRLVATPGHTPGHQSVVVRTSAGTAVVGGQAAFTIEETKSLEPAASNLHDEGTRAAASESLNRINALGPSRIFLSHDAAANIDV